MARVTGAVHSVSRVIEGQGMAVSPYVSQRRPVLTRRPDINPASQFNAGTAIAQTAGAAREIRAADQAAADKHAESEAYLAELERKRANDALSSQVAVNHAEASQRLRVFAETNKNRADYETIYAAEVDREMGATRAMIGDNVEVGQHYAEPLARFAATEKTSATIYAMQVRAKASAEALKTTREVYAGQVQDDFRKLMPTKALIDAQIDANPNIADALKPAAKREEQGYLISRGLAGMVNRGEYDQIDYVLKNPALSAALSPEQRDQFTDALGAGRRAEAAAAKAQVAEDKRVVSETIQAVKARIDAGDDSLGPAELSGLVKRAAAHGDISGATDLQIMMIKVALNRRIKDKSPSQRQAMIGELGRLDALGKLNGTQQIELAHLRTVHGSRNVDEAKPLKDEYATGVNGRVSVARQLQALPYQTRLERAEAIKPGFSAIAVLPPETQEMALRGVEDIERVKDHFGGRAAQAEFTRLLGTAGRAYAMSGEFEAAKAIYAFRARENGVTKWDAGLFKKAVREATGGVEQGGVWRGGVQFYGHGDKLKTIIVPPGFSAVKFQNTINSINYSEARVKGGRPITKADVLAHFTPVLAGNDGTRSVYKWMNDQGGYLNHQNGKQFVTWMDH